MNKSPVAVIIPFYKPNLTRLEETAFLQCFKVLSTYPIICLKPQTLTLPEITHSNDFAKVISFDDRYFNSIQGYNELMLDSSFYKQLLDYEFILIYQLDAFVFRDELLFWCEKKFDYVGAPWLRHRDYPDLIKKIKSKFQAYFDIKLNKRINGVPTNMQFENKVGNGGFSLRRVSKFYELSLQYDEKIRHYNTQSDHRYHEDVFWSIEVNRYKKNLVIPYYKTALKFSFENSPERSLLLNGGKLPFGCHAWDKHIAFWSPYFKDQGVDL